MQASVPQVKGFVWDAVISELLAFWRDILLSDEAIIKSGYFLKWAQIIDFRELLRC